MYWTCSFLVLNSSVNEQSVIIFWVNWCKNGCFWQRIFFKSDRKMCWLKLFSKNMDWPIATISWRVKSMSIKIDYCNNTQPKDQCEARKDYGYPISIAIHRLLFFKLEFFCLVKIFCIFPENYQRLLENQIIGSFLNKLNIINGCSLILLELNCMVVLNIFNLLR